jgi:hypothetical protein
MENLTHYPWLVFGATFVTLWLASVAGSWLRRRSPSAGDEQKEDLGVILAATLTLLALIAGFSFSMATNRYDQRKNFEEGEANAIGTEILRADFLPPVDAANVRKLLGDYLDQRILFYITHDDTRRTRIDERTSQLQADLWAAVRGPAAAQTNAACGAGARWHERRDQFAGLHAGSVLEQDSDRRMVSHGGYRPVLQPAVRLSVAKRQGRGAACSCARAYRLDCLPSDRRYRCSAAWLDPRQSTEPGKPGEVAGALTGATAVAAVMPAHAEANVKECATIAGLFIRSTSKSNARSGYPLGHATV